ncbi:MAG TPA: hypothetical protein VKU19_19175 [Bryobacteraceae bacterium]|nr:hypothetical protein [Bryobacteraceae bacterium]
MSNFLVAVGGSGAKLMQSLIHLGAAGMLPDRAPTLSALLVDPDENNGNVEECQNIEKAYQACKQLVKVGKSDLFAAQLTLAGPWTPIVHHQTDTLKEIFNYNQLANNASEEAELMDLFFERGELEMSVKQGFRGRPAIGATVFANSVNFDRAEWKDFRTAIHHSASSAPPHILFAGSVFGGSGASGVPTLVRLLSNNLETDVSNARYGLVLFLPFFQFRKVEGEAIQADPGSFPLATAEALKYYNERNFLAICHSIYAVGEEIPAEMTVSAVGAKEQRNEPHFIELVAGMGALRFFDADSHSKDYSLAVASRQEEGKLTWDDLPCDPQMGGAQVHKLQNKLQKMAVFAVSYHYIFYPQILEALRAGGSKTPWWVDHIERKNVKPDDSRAALAAVDAYTVKVLEWLLHVSTPRRANFSPGLVNPNVFAVSQGQNWRLKLPREFQQVDLARLLLNRPKTKIDDRTVLTRAARSTVKDDTAAGAGRLVRALFDSCEVE